MSYPIIALGVLLLVVSAAHAVTLWRTRKMLTVEAIDEQIRAALKERSTILSMRRMLGGELREPERKLLAMLEERIDELEKLEGFLTGRR